MDAIAGKFCLPKSSNDAALALGYVGGVCNISGQWFFFGHFSVSNITEREYVEVDFQLEPVRDDQVTMTAMRPLPNGEIEVYKINLREEVDLDPLFNGAFSLWPKEQANRLRSLSYA
jgi:hypothetical protein